MSDNLFRADYSGESVTDGSENIDCGAVQAVGRVVGAACSSTEERYKGRLNKLSITCAPVALLASVLVEPLPPTLMVSTLVLDWTADDGEIEVQIPDGFIEDRGARDKLKLRLYEYKEGGPPQTVRDRNCNHGRNSCLFSSISQVGVSVAVSKMNEITNKNVLAIGQVLNDPNRPLKERFRALFTLKNIGGSTAINCINQCFNDSSALLKHELAYCLGQMQDSKAIPFLKSVLQDTSQEPMVRHEAGEALGAIGSPHVEDILKEFCNDPVIEVAETCQLAIDRIRWLSDTGHTAEKLLQNPYASVDPAPPFLESDVKILQGILMDEEKPLFDRYRAMFALRNLNTEQGLKAGSALFRHEVAFVLGQVQSKASVPYLQASLEDPTENEMVRHECAEALGAIASPDCLAVLQRYLEDEKRVVKESCEIALDMCEYENTPEFQYANTLLKVES
uniref:Deoxyhypusine hydroxylase n=1 Tax=Timema monikensis TaxID=170555 RepID=A0A7R9ECH6_9NEOP|nr:unnamed protein product [Timema monikensis]